ncbi:MAG: Asp-tRNA(Asn)/Glu-tRNA(Gln) amidotransferase subunit GatC [bacterium]|jgi:aspartyl-tRNA(Asn)/glutamyl-tRNA(Gln) amidotransferase subunit C|nr:Asp-tRNA(Asn)/Glu-tRNA(Gln) amidotransferase subunit GatC [bacterium]
MEFSREDVIKLAKLARLHLTDEEIEQYRGDLSSILEYFQKLDHLQLDDVPELQSVSGDTNVFREDDISACTEDTRNIAVDNFSNCEGDLLKVQAVFENRGE